MRTPTPVWRHATAVLLAVLAPLAMAGCGSGDETEPGTATTTSEPRPLTADEAQRLSMMRFTNFTDGIKAVRFEVVDGGRTFTVDGWADFAVHVGYAHVSEDGADPLLVAWTGSAITSHEPVGSSGDGAPPMPPPDDAAWTSSNLAPDESRLHAVLALIFQAGNDRPDNPLLLQQTDARWLRSDDVDGVPVDVVAGPTSDHVYDPATATTAPDGSDATVRYWIDEQSRLLRLEARLGSGPDWTVVDFADAPGVSFADAFLAATTGGS